VSVTLWSPVGLRDDEPAPLLVVHDGPAYVRQARLTHYLAIQVTQVRAALLEVPDRDGWYSANDDYAAALADEVVPRVCRRVRSSSRIGLGTSLGALAMLHAHRRGPGLFDALFLQSGSYFQPIFDSQEAGFAHYRRIVAFVQSALADAGAPVPVPVTMTCGAREENIHNNRAMALALRTQGYSVALHEVPGGHDFTSWRAALDPALGDLLQAGS
jgi:enterochelin esterase-like enzyme